MNKKILSIVMSAALVIPAYPGSKKMWEKKMESSGVEITIIQYQSSDTGARIIDFYADKLVRAGWFLNHRNNNPPALYLTGEDRSQLTVACHDVLNRGITDIVIAHSTGITQEIIEGLSMSTDMPGEEVTSIPRYPGSIRKSYSKMGKNVQIIYESTQGCLDCVVRFYRSAMPAQGWKPLDEIKTDLSKPLQTAEIPQDLKEEMASLSGYPLVGFSYRKGKSEALIGLTEKDGSVFINVNYLPGE